ncbi:hypothetical protein PLESTB_001078900 [Pleodorina starrii]|uniref:PAS domain-containing protein n=1 Tax=Pleodorina starrii TaxID=330485 RepID=A0A9W6BQB4_9CHLO|nr:hypothetical protein PLESTM_001180100 [Pleodorina starrii]GLC56198.1 hypothetical protein PLESTB_001078900 [Pleodorina starrii]GLC74915.1 hypothetical protein PLESTF_001572700 [Pleodorina starrii]
MSGSAIGSASGRSSGVSATSSSRSSASHRVRLDREYQQDGTGEDIFDRSSSLEIGIFGVLCTLRKENNEARVRIRWVLLKIALDALQLFTTVIAPARQGWSIDANGPAWRVVSVLNFYWIADITYGAYLATLYVMVGLLGLHVGLCVWVAWCFKEQKFPVVWPLKALRLFSSVFFQAFDVAALNLLQLGMTCRYTDKESRMHFDFFPQYSCSTAPHVTHAVVSGLSMGLFVAIALLTNMAEVEVNLLSRRPFALGHSGPVVMAFAFKVLLTMVHVFIGWKRVQACLYLALSLGFAWQFVRWAPHLVNWVNYLRSGVAAMVVWSCATLMLLVFHPGIKEHDMDKWADAMTLLMLVGLAPAFGMGALLSWGMIRHMTNATLNELKNAKPGVPLQDVCRSMFDPQDVEIVARCCRVWKDRYTVDPAAVEKARHVVQVGVAMFPNSAYMVLLQGNFMIDVLGVSQSGSRRIEEARKLNPGPMCRFMMFVRQQQASQQAAGHQAQRGASMDLLAYVEYQRKQRMVVRLHREALQAMCNFWRALDTSRVSFTQLSKALGKVETSVSQAQTAYRVVLESYGNNPKLVRLYGKFLQTIKNDPWRASEYFTEADRLEEVQSGDAGGPLLPDGTPLGRMDEIATAVLVISSNGDVQMANRHAHVLFGYKRGTLEGKPMATLLAPHYTRWLSSHLSYIVDRSELLASVNGGRVPEVEDVSGGGGGGGADTVVVGMHSDRVAFPIKLAIRKASGVGEDSTFIAMMEVVPAVKSVASLWVSHNGTVVSADPQYVMSFGWRAHEINGSALNAVMVIVQEFSTGAATSPGDDANGDGALPVASSQMMQQTMTAGASDAIHMLLQAARSGGNENTPGGASVRCLMAHKYDSEPVSCSASIVFTAGLLDAAVYEVKIKLSEAELGRQMLVVNRKGTVLHSSPDLLTKLAGLGVDGVGGGVACFAGNPLAGHNTRAGHNSHHSLPGGAAAGGGGGGGANAVAAAAAAAARGPMGLIGTEQLAAYTLCDFLPTPWKEMHYKYLRGNVTVGPPSSRNPFTCRKDGPVLGPTLELRTAAGKPLYMHVSVSTADVAGEVNHVIRLARSSREAALGERRLRLKATQDGFIAGVEMCPAARLLGLDGHQLAGRAVWDIIDWSSHVDSGSLPAAGPLMFTALIKQELTKPGRSWRIRVSPPAAAVGNITNTSVGQTASELVAAARASMIKPAVMQVHVELPENVGVPGSASPTLYVDLWFSSGVSGVLEVDGAGRVRGILEEDLRPAGLLFGVETPSLVGCTLGELVKLPPGRSKPGDLLFLHGAKKSSLKATTLETSFKVGPMHVLQGVHSDGQPSALEVQVVGRPGSNQSAYVILRSHIAPMVVSVAAVPLAPQPPALEPAPVGLQASAAATAAPGQPKVAAGEPTPAAENGLAPCGSGGLRSSPVSGVARVSTPSMEPQPRRAAADGNTSSVCLTGVEEDSLAIAAALLGSDPPNPPPLPERLGTGLLVGGEGLPMPAVAQLPGRDKLADLVRSVESNRSADEGSLGRKATGGGRSGGSQGGVDGIIPRLLLGEGVDGSGRTADGRQQTAAAASATNGGNNKWRDDALLMDGPSGPGLDVESVDGEIEEPKQRGVAADAGKERISTWVASQGAYYQNSVIPDKAKGDDDGPFGSLRRGGDGDDLPTVGAVDIKSLLRKGTAADDLEEAGDMVTGNGRRNATGAAAIGSPTASGGGSEWARRRADRTPPDYPDDDAASEGGQSAMSGQSGDGGADYKRGKRFRKLMKLMDSGQAQQVQRRYQRHALATMALLAAVHIVCFALTVHSIRTKRDSMLQLGRSGQAQRYMHQIMTDVRSLDIISRNKTQPNLYNASQVSFFIDRISHATDEIQIRYKSILDSHKYSSSASRVRDLLFYTSLKVWDGNEVDGSDKYTNITNWDFTTRFCVMAKDVEQNGKEWVKNGVAIVDNTTAGQFLIKSGPDLWRASRRVLDALLFVAVDDARWVDNLQIVFLCVEGAAVTSIAACYLAYLLRGVAAQRYKLYSIFMLIPLGLTRALASQNTNLIVDEEDEDDIDDIDDKPSTAADDAGAGSEGDTPTSSGAAAALSQSKPKRRAILALFESKTGGGGSSGGNPDDDGGGPRLAESRNRSFRTRSGRPPSQDTTAGGSTGGQNGAYGAFGRTALRLRQIFSKRGARVAPLPRVSSSGGDAASKRKLKYDSHETYWLLMPFVAWSTLVVTIYTIVVAQMRGIVGVLAVHSVVNFIAARTYRAVFFSQELAAVEDPSLLTSRRAAVAAVWKVVRDAWFTLQLGQDAYKAAGPSTERFPLVEKGLAYSSTKLANIFYGNHQCHRLPASGPCPGPEYRFYQAIYAGLDSIMHQFMMHVEAMGFSTDPMPPGLSDEHLDFIYNVGTKDLMDGTVEIQEAHLDTIMFLFQELFVLHIILLVLFWVIFLSFLIFLLSPLLTRISRERRRVADLMSQLPLELDVEKLVARALGTSPAGGAVVVGGLGGQAAASGGEAAAVTGLPAASDGAAADAFTKWKNIIRMSTNSSLAKQQSVNRRGP